MCAYISMHANAYMNMDIHKMHIKHAYEYACTVVAFYKLACMCMHIRMRILYASTHLHTCISICIHAYKCTYTCACKYVL